jgi:hypothetical protein
MDDLRGIQRQYRLYMTVCLQAIFRRKPPLKMRLRCIQRAKRLFFFIRTSITLGINETLGETTELKITSQVASFIKQILFMAYGRSSIVLTELLLFWN